MAKPCPVCNNGSMLHPWGIYVHIPWCRRRCPYCDFYLEVGKPEASFADRLSAEFDQRRGDYPGSEATTLYFGGGTPSLLSVADLQAFMKGMTLAPGAEVTLEANPEDVTPDAVAGWMSAGVNRVSLGIQSFDDVILKQLGRKHRSDEAYKAIEICIAAGLSRVSVDLIFGVPNEKGEAIAQSVHKVRAMGVGQISAYLLTVEAGTALAKHILNGRAKAPDDDAQADAYEQIQNVMSRHSFRQYEISSFAKEGQESRHNRNYWGKGAYLGLGPSAHSMRLLSDGSIERSKNKPALQAWSLEREIEVLSKEEAFLESIAFGLRDLIAGVSVEALEHKHHTVAPSGLLAALQISRDRGWVEKRAGNFYLTQVGVRFSDAVAREILACG